MRWFRMQSINGMGPPFSYSGSVACQCCSAEGWPIMVPFVVELGLDSTVSGNKQWLTYV